MSEDITSKSEELELVSVSVIEQLVLDTSLATTLSAITVLIDEIEARSGRLRGAWGAQDLEDVYKQAHALKSCSSTFGGLRLQYVARKLEDAAANENKDEVEQLIPVLLPLKDKTIQAYSQYKAELQIRL